MVKTSSILATVAILLGTLVRPGDAHRSGRVRDGGESSQAVGEAPLTAEAQQRLVEECKQIFLFDTFGDEVFRGETLHATAVLDSSAAFSRRGPPRDLL